MCVCINLSFLSMFELVNNEKITMKNNSEKPTVNATQSVDAYSTMSHLNIEKIEQEYMEMFWTDQEREMEKIDNFKNNLLVSPNRIKNIMKTNKDVRRITSESPVLLAKACDFFIQELTLRSWLNAQENHRRILKKKDVTDVIKRNDNLNFLFDDDVNSTGGNNGHT